MSDTVTVTIDESKIQSAHHRALVGELRLLNGSRLDAPRSKRARHLVRMLMRYGIIVPAMSGIAPNPVPQSPIGVQALDHG